MRWQNINTAPVDGRAILITDGLEVHVAYSIVGSWFCYHHSTWKGTALSDVMGEPTHWMELPELPSGQPATNSKPVLAEEETIEIHEVK